MTLQKRLLAEFLGTAGLLVVVVGSGIMGEQLAQGNAAIALLANSIATGAGLYALIQTFGPISGAHFNPAVSLIERFWKRLSTKELFAYSFVQLAGAIVGVLATHLMFGLQIFQLSQKNRGEFRLFFSEVIATLGLLLVIAFSGKKNVHATPAAVALYITAAYWCTSSTSFANPAVTVARSLSDTFSGILWTGAPWFIAAQLIGAALAFGLSRTLAERNCSSSV
jgi:glycerol uptake facilitator-like aquaporin